MTGLRNYKPSGVRSTIAEYVKLPLLKDDEIQSDEDSSSPDIVVTDSADPTGVFLSSKRRVTFYLEKSKTCQENDPKSDLKAIAKGNAIPGCVINIKNQFGFERGQIVSNGDGTSTDVPIGQAFYYKNSKNPVEGGFIFNIPNGRAAGPPIKVINFQKSK